MKNRFSSDVATPNLDAEVTYMNSPVVDGMPIADQFSMEKDNHPGSSHEKQRRKEHTTIDAYTKKPPEMRVA